MTATRWMAMATVTWAFWQMPGLAQAEVFKCAVGGRTVYQDVPCVDTTEAPHKTTGVPGAARTDAGVKTNTVSMSSDPATLQRQLRDAREESARLRALYEKEFQQTKSATMSLDQQRQLTKVLHARWDPKLQAAGRREQELTDALRKICPSDVQPNAQTQHCRK